MTNYFRRDRLTFPVSFCLHLEKLTEFFVKSVCKQGDFHPFFKKGSICRMQVKKKKKSRRGQSNDLTRFFGRMWSLPFCPPALKTKREDQQQRRRSTFFSHNFGQERDWDSTWNLLVSGRHAPNLKGFSNNNNFGPWRNEKIVSLASISGSNSCNELC